MMFQTVLRRQIRNSVDPLSLDDLRPCLLRRGNVATIRLHLAPLEVIMNSLFIL